MQGYIHSTESFGTVDHTGYPVRHLFTGLSDALPVLSQS